MRKIEIKLAKDYIEKYASKMKAFGVDAPGNGFTKSVGFNKKELQDWIQKLGKDTSEIKIFFGIYSGLSSSVNLLRAPEEEGRFTTILWPYNAEGEPAKDEEGNDELPVNLGDLLP